MGRLRKGPGMPGRAQGEPRRHAKVTGPCFAKVRFFAAGCHLVAPRGLKNAGGSRWRERKSRNSRPSEGGRVGRFLGQPWAVPGGALYSHRFLPLVPILLGGAWGLGWPQASLGRVREGSGLPGRTQGDPRSHPKMTRQRFKKMRFFAAGRPLAAPGGPKNAGGPRWREGKNRNIS